ncbi:12S rRNA N4-methylcytidine methyltransferase [Lemmus lemmus]
MLRYSCFCRMYKGLFYCWVESGAFNLGVCPQAMHTSAAVHTKYESQEEEALYGTRNVHRSAEKDSEDMAKLHIPVMVDEVIHCLTPQKGQVFLDMTFGAGGHTKAILQKEPDITVFALDRDPTAYAIAKQLSQVYPCYGCWLCLSPLFHFQNCGGTITAISGPARKQVQALLGQFSEAETLLIKAGVQPGTIDGVLLDLGCSSMQLDAPERGFSLRKDGPLDMRMDADRPTAADVVNALDQQALASILRAYGEEKHAKKIASAIIQARSIYPISRTQQLAVYARKDLLQRSTHIATKTFQALRIFVNNELNELYTGLKTAQKFLKTGGRLVALSFHSLEDRIVKRFLKVRQTAQLDSNHESEGSSSVRAPLMWDLIHKKVLTPEDQDVQDNPRGRSAKLRAAIKL